MGGEEEEEKSFKKKIKRKTAHSHIGFKWAQTQAMNYTKKTNIGRGGERDTEKYWQANVTMLTQNSMVFTPPCASLSGCKSQLCPCSLFPGKGVQQCSLREKYIFLKNTHVIPNLAWSQKMNCFKFRFFSLSLLFPLKNSNPRSEFIF